MYFKIGKEPGCLSRNLYLEYASIKPDLIKGKGTHDSYPTELLMLSMLI